MKINFTQNQINNNFGHSDHKNKTKQGLNLPVLITTGISTIVPILIIRKYQGKSFDFKKVTNASAFEKIKELYKTFDVQYNLKEMLLVANSAIVGGFLGTKFFGDKSKEQSRAKESVFQMFNTTLATSMVAGLIKLAESHKQSNNNLCKIGCIMIGLAMGIPTALFVAKKVNKQIFGEDEFTKRKLQGHDLLIHTDDLVSASILAKFPLVDKLPLDKILALIFAKVGYDCGTKD